MRQPSLKDGPAAEHARDRRSLGCTVRADGAGTKAGESADPIIMPANKVRRRPRQPADGQRAASELQ